MMKTARFVLKIVGFSLSALACACLIVGYWDKIARGFRRLNAKMTGIPPVPTEYDEFEGIL